MSGPLRLCLIPSPILSTTKHTKDTKQASCFFVSFVCFVVQCALFVRPSTSVALFRGRQVPDLAHLLEQRVRLAGAALGQVQVRGGAARVVGVVVDERKQEDGARLGRLLVRD